MKNESTNIETHNGEKWKTKNTTNCNLSSSQSSSNSRHFRGMLGNKDNSNNLNNCQCDNLLCHELPNRLNSISYINDWHEMGYVPLNKVNYHYVSFDNINNCDKPIINNDKEKENHKNKRYQFI